MQTLVMVRTECCQTYKQTGERCAICPNRPENKASVQQYLSEVSSKPLGRRLGLMPCIPAAHTASASR